MNKHQAKKFLEQAIQECDTITFLVYPSTGHDFIYRIYNDLIEIGSELALVLHNQSYSIFERKLHLTLEELDDKKILSYSSASMITQLLSEYLFQNSYSLRIDLEIKDA